jgi:hypothetical protein
VKEMREWRKVSLGKKIIFVHPLILVKDQQEMSRIHQKTEIIFRIILNHQYFLHNLNYPFDDDIWKC